MVFNQNHASILYFVSSIIIIVGLPTGFYLMFRMLDVRQVRSEARTKDLKDCPEMVYHRRIMIDHIKYASTEIGEGFMIGLQNGLNETLLNSLAITFEDKSSPVRPDGVLQRHPDTPASQSIPRTPAQVVPPCFGVLTKQITHTVVISAMIYRDPPPPLLQHI